MFDLLVLQEIVKETRKESKLFYFCLVMWREWNEIKENMKKKKKNGNFCSCNQFSLRISTISMEPFGLLLIFILFSFSSCKAITVLLDIGYEFEPEIAAFFCHQTFVGVFGVIVQMLWSLVVGWWRWWKGCLNTSAEFIPSLFFYQNHGCVASASREEKYVGEHVFNWCGKCLALRF